MPAIQPPFIPIYFKNIFHVEKTKNNSHLHQAFFLSWEDALWQLLKNHHVLSDAKVLVPSFFCGDVIFNMKNHKLIPIFYDVNKQLQPNKNDFISQLQKHQPQLVVIFNAVGITNLLFENIDWLSFLPKKALLIEDCAHRLLKPNKIKFITPNHYLIDSLRKVSPIQGSRVFALHPIKELSLSNNLITFRYRMRVIFWWLVMQFFLITAHFTKNEVVQQLANKFAEKTMKIGYDVIGDHSCPSPAPRIMTYLATKLDIQHVEQQKIEQAKLYLHLLKRVFRGKYFFEIPFLDSDKKQLRGFPLGIELKHSTLILKKLRSHHLLVRFELNDSPWATKQKVVYLPMGPHVRQQDIKNICQIIKKVV